MENIELLVQKYKLTLYGEENIKFGGTKAEFEKALPLLKEHKAEIIAYLKKQEADRKATVKERQAKINAIEGLTEIKNAIYDLNRWEEEFNASFDDVGGLGVRPKPKYDMDALYKKYPVATAYLKAEKEAEKSNYELSNIGKKALNKIIDCPENYIAIIEEMEREIKAFVERHMWD